MGKLTFVLHDESVNTYGFRMLTSGANLEEFKKNPVMLLNHDDYSLPIGRWENIRVEGGKILADAVFDEGDARAAEVKRKVENVTVTVKDGTVTVTGEAHPGADVLNREQAQELLLSPLASKGSKVPSEIWKNIPSDWFPLPLYCATADEF